MNFYAFHLGDYASATRHLSWDEDCAFRRLLDAYYTTERPLPSDPSRVFRLVGAVSDTQREAVRVVLAEFFQATDEGFRNTRADEEIAAYRVKQGKARASANARWNAAKPTSDSVGNADALQAQCGPNAPNPNPNPNPKKTDKRAPAARFDARASLLSVGVASDVADDWLTVRKAKRAPTTANAIEGVTREATKAGWSLDAALRECIARGWAGFKAEWVASTPGRANPADVARVTVPGPTGEDPALKKIREDRAQAVPPSPEVRARLSALKRKGPDDANVPV